MDCPFCNYVSDKILIESDYGYALYGNYPISPGHILVIPKQHTESYFDLTATTHNELNTLIIRAKEYLEEKHRPDGYNIGINDGRAAGQTISHLHVHLMPRYDGDQKDPRGGVRWIFPDKAIYWE